MLLVIILTNNFQKCMVTKQYSDETSLIYLNESNLTDNLKLLIYLL